MRPVFHGESNGDDVMAVRPFPHDPEDHLEARRHGALRLKSNIIKCSEIHVFFIRNFMT